MEWDSNPRLRRDWCLKPAPWTARPSNRCRPPPPRAARACLRGKTKSLRRPGIKPGSRPWQGRILSLYYRRSPLSIPRLELGTSRVLGERHNQLDHTDGWERRRLGVSGFRSQYLVLAKDARFRLRQYPCRVSNGVSGFRSQYLVLAKHARFRLRQYPDG